MTTALQEQSNRGTGRLAGSYPTFFLAGQSCVMDVLQVREIFHRPAIHTVPQMPAHVRGMIKLKGAVKALLDINAVVGAGTMESVRIPGSSTLASKVE